MDIEKETGVYNRDKFFGAVVLKSVLNIAKLEFEMLASPFCAYMYLRMLHTPICYYH